MSLRRAVALRLIEADHFEDPERARALRPAAAPGCGAPPPEPGRRATRSASGRAAASSRSRLIRGQDRSRAARGRLAATAGSLEPLGGALAAVHARGPGARPGLGAEHPGGGGGTPYLADLGARTRAGAPRRTSGRSRTSSPGFPSARHAASAARRGSAAPGARRPVRSPRPRRARRGGERRRASRRRPAPRRSDAAPSPAPTRPRARSAQLSSAGGPSRCDRPGVIRSWEVRGASGDLALQVIREQDGRSFVVGFSQPERLTSPVQRAFRPRSRCKDGRPGSGSCCAGRLDRRRPGAARVGDRALGRRPHAGPQAATRNAAGRRADARRGDRVRREAGRARASSRAPRRRRRRQGNRSPRCPCRCRAAERARVVVVELPGGIAVDVFRRASAWRGWTSPTPTRRATCSSWSRTAAAERSRGFCLRWQNPGEELALIHEYRVRPSGGSS